MDFLKRQLFLILCGVGAVGGIALMVTGVRAMPAVKAEMEKVEQLYQNLGTLQQKPVNESILEATRQRIEQVVADRNAVVNKAKDLSRYELLVPEAFPDGPPEARLKFKRAYLDEMDKLFEMLRAGRPAGETEFSLMKDKIEEEAVRRQKLGTPPSDDELGPETTPSGFLTKAGARKDPVARAQLAAAQRIYCYGVAFKDSKPPELEPSLFVETGLRDPGMAQAPDAASTWRAQVGYWIQKDVVEAIVALNEEAATAARDKNLDRWVGIMPVKEVVSIRLSKGYVKPSEDKFTGGAPGGNNAAIPPAAPKTAFTKSASSESFEVVQFTVKLVMDQRDVLRFVEKLCNGRAHVPLRIAYKAIEPSRGLKGKVYGSEPAVSVVMDFETIMIGDQFRPWIPTKVCEDDGIPCGREKKAESGG